MAKIETVLLTQTTQQAGTPYWSKLTVHTSQSAKDGGAYHVGVSVNGAVTADGTSITRYPEGYRDGGRMVDNRQAVVGGYNVVCPDKATADARHADYVARFTAEGWAPRQRRARLSGIPTPAVALQTADVALQTADVAPVTDETAEAVKVARRVKQARAHTV